MNRPLKFRVWDTKHKKFLIGIPPMEYMLDHEVWSHRDIEEDPCVYLNNVFSKDFNGRLIFQQYTGLNDKTNKEIYEGDIVKYKTWTGSYDGTTEEHQTQVQFKDGAYYPRYIDDECEDSWYSFKVYDLEVVGNIMETPHLDENE